MSVKMSGKIGPAGEMSGSLGAVGGVNGSMRGNIGPISPEIRDGAVTTPKLADEAVTADKIADGAVTADKFDPSLIDDTLSVAGAMADAKAVGDALADKADASDLGDAAEYDVADDLTTVTSGSKVLDAAQGKALGDRLTSAEATLSGLGAAATYGVANDLTTATSGSKVLDAAQGKALKDALGVIGALTSGTATATASANTAFTTQGNIALAKGRYIVFAGVEWPSNATGRRVIMFTASNTSSTAIDTPMAVSRAGALDGTGTIQHLAFHYTASSNVTIYLRSWQNSGSSLTPSTVKLNAVRLE